jgi:protein-S-isoprenylcysteine O-methyltransferase Ste14
MLLFHEGIWDFVIYPLTGIRLPGIVAFAFLVAFFGGFVARRVHYEEAMLSKHFGKEWTEFASTRWRIIPYVY